MEDGIVRNFLPDLAIATLQYRQQDCLVPKFGGLPWGFPQDLWRNCRECGQPLALLAQLPHQLPALDLGAPKWVLHLFQCTTAGCGTWSHDGGCNAAFALSCDALAEGLTRPPDAATPRPVSAWVGPDRIPIQDPSMHGEIWITGWREHEDMVSPHESAAYIDPIEFYALPQELQFPHHFDCRLATKAGGVPYWTGNGPGALPGIPQPPYRYLMQIDSALVLRGSLPSPSAVGCDVHLAHWNAQRNAVDKMETLAVPEANRRENAPWHISQEILPGDAASEKTGTEDEYFAAFANFGSDGTAYVFIDRDKSPPDVLLFWNR
jgi:hypothetical protein